MSFTYGFYNSINHDRMYNADQMGRIFDGIINDGVYMNILNSLQVRSAGTGMSIIVGGGRAWFNHTWSYNDNDYPMIIEEADIIGNRIDAVVLKVDRSDAVRANTIEIVKGVVATSPSKPELIDTEFVFYHPLAYITVSAGITEIKDSMIENAIGVDSRTPFVTGIIDHVSIGDLVNQWKSEWHEWVDVQELDFENWQKSHKSEYNLWISAQESAFEEWSSNEQQTYKSWEDAQKQAFADWFSNIQYVLDGDAAGHLQNEIDNSNKKEFDREYELIGSKSHIIRDSSGYIVGINTVDDDGVKTSTTFETFNNGESYKITSVIQKDADVYTRVTEVDGDDITKTIQK